MLARIMKFGCVLMVASSLGWGCTPGKLSDEEKRQFQRELERRYPAETDSTETDSTETDSTETPDAGETEPEASETEEPETEEPEASETEEPDGGPMATEPSESGLEFAPCVLEVFATGCAGALCHYDAIAAFPPDLERPDLADFLVTQQPTCRDVESYIDLEQPNQSLMLLKVLGEQPGGCGTPMPPPGAPALSADQIQCLVDWFDSL